MRGRRWRTGGPVVSSRVRFTFACTNVKDIQNFLIELGTGFAFYGRQRALLVGEQEYFLDRGSCGTQPS